MYFFRLCTNDNINIFFGQFSHLFHIIWDFIQLKLSISIQIYKIWVYRSIENCTKQTIERILTLKAQTIEKFLLK